MTVLDLKDVVPDRVTATRKYPWDELEVGLGFEMPSLLKAQDIAWTRNHRMSKRGLPMRYRAIRHGEKFYIRREK